MALVGIVLALAAGGGLALWEAAARADAKDESVATEGGDPQLGHHQDTAAATITLGSAGSVTVDIQNGQATLSYPNPSGGWMVTDKRDECTELTLLSGDGEIVTVSLVFENSAVWVEIMDQLAGEVRRVFFAEQASSGAETQQDPIRDDIERLEPDPADPPSTATSTGPSSGVPATGVAPGGGDTSPSTTTAQATTTTSTSGPSSTTTASSTTTVPSSTTTTTQACEGDDDCDDD